MMSYLFKYFLHYSKCITMYLCMYTCTYLVECVTLYGPPSSLPSAVSAHSSAMHWPRLRCASSSPPSSSSSSRTIERGCRPDRTRGARTAMISGVWSARNTRGIASDSSNRRRWRTTLRRRAWWTSTSRLCGWAALSGCLRGARGSLRRAESGCAPLVFASLINQCDALCVIAGPCWYFWAGGSGRQWHLRTSVQGRCGLSLTTFTKSFTASLRLLRYSFTAQ